MYPAGVAVDSGQRASVPIVVDLRGMVGTFLGSYQLQLTWDPAIVRYVGTSAGAFGAPTVNEGSAASGTLVLAGARPDGRQGLFSVAEVTFEMLVSTGSSPVLVNAPELTETGSFGSISVVTTPGNVCNGPGDFGDVNGDGNILSNDALLVVTAAVGLPIAPYTLVNADVDSDGDADTRDALVILTAAVGLPTTGFVVGQPNPASSCGGSAAASIALNPGVANAATGDVFPISAQVFDAGGDPTAAQGLVWSTDASGVATVDSLGRVTAVGNGSAQISAMAIGVPPQSVNVTVADRHTWYVDAAGAATKTVQLGSAFFPFADVQPALDAAAPGDTVLVIYASSGYGAASITKPVTMLGDSGASGMPALRNSVGPAVVSNATGLVTLRRLSLEQSNAGLDARGDSLVVESVVATTLRGPGFGIHGMQSAELAGITVNSAILAGVLADSTASVRINGIDVRVIAQRNDSSAGIAILNGGTAVVNGLNLLGIENGPAAVFSKLASGVLDGFDVRAAGGINADSVGSMTLAHGQVREGGSDGDRTISIHADTVALDSVLVDGVDRGVELTPISRDTATSPNSVASITRSAFRNIAGDGGVIIDRFAQVTIADLTVQNVQLDHGIDIRRSDNVQIDSVNVSGIGEGRAISVDPTGSLTIRHAKLRGHGGGLDVDDVAVVTLAHVEVDSSAIPPQFCFGCPSGWAVRIVHADSVILDSLNIHDNMGGGILVDSARIVAGHGTIVSRNQGFGGFGGGECEFGCEQQGRLRQSPPLRPALSHGQYAQNFVQGVVLNLVQSTRLAAWTVHDNANGGVYFAGWNFVAAPSATIDTSSFRGNRTLLEAAGNSGLYDAQLAVRGGRFVGFETSLSVSYLLDLNVTGAVFDSAGSYGRPAIVTYFARNVQIQDDTLLGGQGWGMKISSAARATVQGNLIRGRMQADGFTQEAAIELESVDTGSVAQNRLELNAVRGIIVRNGTGPMAIDGNVVADDSGFAAVQLHQPAVVTNNLFARNFNAVYVTDAGGPSAIQQNNFIGNVFTAVRNESGQVVDATSNWWNDVLGPRCTGVAAGCDPLSTGDIANGSGFGVDFSGFLTSPAAGAPIAVPRFLPASRRQTR